MRKLIVDLNRYETVLYFVGWSGGVFYSLYQLYLACSYFDDYSDYYHDFSPGWSWVGRKRDTADSEWTTWIPFIFNLFPWIAAHLFISQLLKYLRCSTTTLCCWYIAISMTFLCNYVGVVAMIFMLTQPCIACLLTSFRSKKVAYMVYLTMLVVIELTPVLHVILRRWMKLEIRSYYMIVLAVCWTQLKVISCTIDNIVDYKHKNLIGFLKNFIETTAYCLYLPTLFLGPFTLYSEFVKGINVPYQKWTFSRISIFALNLARFVFWIYFTELSMHFVYCNVLEYYVDYVASLKSWAFYGMGYCMGQYFLNKYVVVYGIGGEFSRADDISAPPPPKCIGRVHLYSEMWKHFDRGLYQFLVRYIYVPIASMNVPLQKIVASFVTFSFIFLWHGVHLFVFTWSFLNFLGLTVEGIAKAIGNREEYIAWEDQYLSAQNRRRFYCILASPLLGFSAISNFYFFGGQEIGNAFIYRVFHDSPVTTGILLFFLYCCCQVSTEVKNYELRKDMKYEKCEIIKGN